MTKRYVIIILAAILGVLLAYFIPDAIRKHRERAAHERFVRSTGKPYDPNEPSNVVW